MPTLSDIREARLRLEGNIVLTPCARSLAFVDDLPCEVWFKFENMHRMGAFKERGALNRLSLLTDEERRRGVVAASAGNHAQAVALHATRLGIPSTVVMPETAPFIKVTRTRNYGARVVLKGARFSDAIAEAKRLHDTEGLVMVHAFDDPHVIAGQGTIGLEIAEQVPHVTTVVVPIGGGGVISGTAIAIKALKPEVRVIGVEADAAPTALRSRERGEIVDIETSDTLADGIAVKRVGDLTFPIIEQLVDDIVTVGEEEIASAIMLLLEREKTLVEGAGAVPLAALLAGRIPVSADDVVVPVLCGGNIDVSTLSRIIERGLVGDGRLARLMVKVRDRPGSLARLTDRVAHLGANVLEIGHRRGFADISVGDVEIVMHLETRGRDHVEEIVTGLEAAGLVVEEYL
ncbi:MAG: threonine ammonia-lyase [Gemmatimonadota bacterium]